MLKVIKTEADYDTALIEIEDLIDLDPGEGTDEGDRLDLLTLLIQAYEEKKYHFDLPDPVDAIKFCMEQRDLTRRDLEAYIGSKSKVSEILSGKRSLTLSMIRALQVGLGIPAEVLLQERDPSLLEESNIDWGRFPLKEMINRSWIQGKYSDLHHQAEDVLREFFAPTGPPSGIPALLRRTKTEHIRSARSMDLYALASWKGRVLRWMLEDPPQAEYKSGTVNLTFMRKVAQLSPSDDGPILARDFLRENGISLIIEQHLPQTYLDGAAFLSQSNSPIIGLTLRYDRIDNFWFSLMHELAHIALHIGKEVSQFYDDLDIGDQGSTYEQQADLLAGEALIPEAEWKASPASGSRSPAAAAALAEKLGIHHAIVAGRIRYMFKSYRVLNQLVGHKQVRRHFPEVTWS